MKLKNENHYTTTIKVNYSKQYYLKYNLLTIKLIKKKIMLFQIIIIQKEIWYVYLIIIYFTPYKDKFLQILHNQ